MTQRDAEHAENIIREIERRRGHRQRVVTCLGLLALGALSLWAVWSVLEWLMHAVVL